MRIPKHIGIIPDGNRRWAKQSGRKKEEGYAYGLEPGLALLQAAREYGVSELTFYGFTKDNLKRPKAQVEAFQKACVDAVGKIAEQGVSLLVVGDRNSPYFPQELLPFRTRANEIDHKEKIKVNFLVNYGWDWDLKNGFVSKEISRMDMIIRWGGMRRLSGFLPVQSAYADFYIVDALWPDFEKDDFVKALAWYQKQDVTLGG